MQIFSLLMQLFMGHIVPCLHFIERENIFLQVYPQLSFFFKTWFVSFYLSPSLLFFLKTIFPKTYFVFPIFIGRVVSISYRVELFCVPLIFFLLSFIAYVYSLMSCLCQYVTRKGRSGWNVGILFVLFRGRYIDCLW